MRYVAYHLIFYYMGYNSYTRPTTPKRRYVSPEEPSKFKQALQTISEVEKNGQTAMNVLKHVKPANRNIIGLLGAAALVYWAATAKK